MFSITFESMAIYHFFNYQYYIFSIIGKSLEKQKKYGWIILDYPTENVIKNIVESNF